MYKLWLKVNEAGVITHTLFGSFSGEPLGFDANFVVEDREMITALRNSVEDWYVKDNKLCKKELISLKIETIKPEGSEDDIIRANGIDEVKVTVEGCTAPEVVLYLSKEKMVLQAGEELILTSKRPTTVVLEAKGVGYKMKKPVFVRFK